MGKNELLVNVWLFLRILEENGVGLLEISAIHFNQACLASTC